MVQLGTFFHTSSSARGGLARAGWTRRAFLLRRAERLSYTPVRRRRLADLLSIRDLRVHIAVDAGTVKAVDGVSFRVPERGTVALVGESGSGKSVVAQSIMGILPRIARIESGEILFRDPNHPGAVIDLARMNPLGREMQAIRGGRISI